MSGQVEKADVTRGGAEIRQKCPTFRCALLKAAQIEHGYYSGHIRLLYRFPSAANAYKSHRLPLARKETIGPSKAIATNNFPRRAGDMMMIVITAGDMAELRRVLRCGKDEEDFPTLWRAWPATAAFSMPRSIYGPFSNFWRFTSDISRKSVYNKIIVK
ncbi:MULTISPECIES: hypothetical protein [unclassified Mesorhizobium]|uniref:hypothetical protein n=1 Tax=unclassified Mesorhizobium TaxID=325217 RepID=UPI001FE1A5F9|nr:MULTISPECIES: hypothetical protein [unclassified Mesorhizobium]